MNPHVRPCRPTMCHDSVQIGYVVDAVPSFSRMRLTMGAKVAGRFCGPWHLRKRNLTQLPGGMANRVLKIPCPLGTRVTPMMMHIEDVAALWWTSTPASVGCRHIGQLTKFSRSPSSHTRLTNVTCMLNLELGRNKKLLCAHHHVDSQHIDGSAEVSPFLPINF